MEEMYRVRFSCVVGGVHRDEIVQALKDFSVTYCSDFPCTLCFELLGLCEDEEEEEQ